MSKHGVSRVNVTVDDIRRMAAEAGIGVETHAPGDGIRRFSFMLPRRGQPGVYERRLYTAHGINEALLFMEAFEIGYTLARQGHISGPKKYGENVPRIIFRVGEYKVYRDAEYDEYEVRHAREQAGEGYFTQDKDDAIDTAKIRAEEEPDGIRRNPGRHYDRRHPGYKGKIGEFPEDDFAYRGYRVRKRLAEQYWDISKDGFHIGGANSPEEARGIIADLTRE